MANFGAFVAKKPWKATWLPSILAFTSPFHQIGSHRWNLNPKGQKLSCERTNPKTQNDTRFMVIAEFVDGVLKPRPTPCNTFMILRPLLPFFRLPAAFAARSFGRSVLNCSTRTFARIEAKLRPPQRIERRQSTTNRTNTIDSSI